MGGLQNRPSLFVALRWISTSHNRVHTAVYALTALLAFEGSLAHGLAERQPTAEIFAAAPTHDFGTSRQGQPIVHALYSRIEGRSRRSSIASISRGAG